jgi:hypothetical protein
MLPDPRSTQPADDDWDNDPIVRLLISGEAQTFEEAEEVYLDRSLPEVYRLLASSMTNDELANHPLMRLLYFRGSRGWEDSL